RLSSWLAPRVAFLGEIDRQQDKRTDRDPQHLVPVEEWNACKLRHEPVVKRWPEHRDVRKDEKKMYKTEASLRTVHRKSPAISTWRWIRDSGSPAKRCSG